MKKTNGNSNRPAHPDPGTDAQTDTGQPESGNSKPEEQELVERLKKGQEWAFHQLVNQYQDRLLKVAYSITLDREESLEVVQDTFVNVHRNISAFRQDAALFTWMRKITIRLCLNWKRKWKRRFKWHHQPIDSENESVLNPESFKGQTPETLIREKQMEERLMTAVKALPGKIRAVFVLSTFEGMSYEQIGDILNISKGTVSSRLHTARTRLTKVLAPPENNNGT